LIRTVEPTGVVAAVVKLQVTALARAVPSAALTVVSSFAVYVVEVESAELGVSAAVLVVASYVTVAGTTPLGPVSVKLELVIVEVSIAREKLAVGWIAVATFVDASAGVLPVTVGAGGGPVDGTTSIAASSGSSIEPYTDFRFRKPPVTFTP
jgi:hypothetical protein